MNSALKILQQEKPDLTVSFTLMIQGDDYGLTDALGVGVLKSAERWVWDLIYLLVGSLFKKQ